METNSIYSTSHRKHEIAHELNNQPIEESIMDSLENFSKQKKQEKMDQMAMSSHYGFG